MVRNGWRWLKMAVNCMKINRILINLRLIKIALSCAEFVATEQA